MLYKYLLELQSFGFFSDTEIFPEKKIAARPLLLVSIISGVIEAWVTW